MTCNFLAPNGEKSILAAGLLQKYGPDIQAKVWNHVHSNMGKFESVELDDNNEPTLSSVEKVVPAMMNLPAPPVAGSKEPLKAKSTQSVLVGTINKATGERPSAEEMVDLIQKLYARAEANPTIEYQVGYQNLFDRERQSNGYTTKELANLFESAGVPPPNVSFTPSFVQILEALPTRYASEFSIEDQAKRQVLNYERVVVVRQLNQLFVPIFDADGKQVGNFTSEKQIEAVDAVMWLVYKQLQADPKMRVSTAFSEAAKMIKAQSIRMEKQGNLQAAKDLENITSSFAFNPANGNSSIAGLVLNLMEQYGIKVKNKKKVLMQLETYKNQLKVTYNASMTLEDLVIVDTTDVRQLIDNDKEFSFEEGTALEDFSDTAAELDPRDTASWKLKLFMATLENTERVKNEDGTFKYQSERNSFGFPTLVNFDNVYEKTMGVLADQNVKTWDNYKKVLQENAAINPVFGPMITKLEAPGNENLRNEFVKVMSVHYQKYMMMTFNIQVRNEKTVWILNPFDANRASQINELISVWQENQKMSRAMIVKEGKRVIDIEFMRARPVSYIKAFNLVFNVLPKAYKDATPDGYKTPQQLAENKERIDVLIKELTEHVSKAKPDIPLKDFINRPHEYAADFIKKMLAAHGIVFTEVMVADLIDNLAMRTKGTKLSGSNIGSLFQFNRDETPSGLMSVFVWKAAGLIKEGDNIETMTEKDEVNATVINNPMYTESTTMKVLARVAAAHTKLLSTSSHRTSEGKTNYDYTLNNALSIKVNEMLNTTDEEYKEVYDKAQAVHISANNYLLDAWNERVDRENAGVTMLDGLKPVWRTTGTVRTGMSDREQMLLGIGLFQNRNKNKSHYIGLTHSDKTMTPIMTNFPRIKMGGAKVVSGQALKAVRRILNAEMKRIVAHQAEDFNHAQYQVGKRLFFTLPQFNYDAMVQLKKDGELFNFGDGQPRPINDDDIAALWYGPNDLASTVNDRAEKVITGMINKFISDLTKDTREQWEEAGITSKESLTHSFHEKYVRAIQNNDSYNGWRSVKQITDRGKTKWILVGKDKKVLTDEEVFEGTVETAARDYALNNWLVNVSMSQLVYGDMAQAAKFKKDQVVDGKSKPGQAMKIVEATMKEYSKRLAKDIAPGQDLHWAKPDYLTITLADVDAAEDYIKDEFLKKAYSKVDATDAQELTTVQEHLDMIMAAGKMLKSTYDAMSLIVSNNKGKFYEFTDPDHLAIIMQPAKPVFVGTRPNDRGTTFHDYIKSSAYPLYPPFTANSKIDKLRIEMENNDIARANFASGKKVGAPIKPLVVFNPDGSFVEGAFKTDTWKEASQVLSRSGIRIQQEVPYDEEKEAIRTVSQMNKLIVEGLGRIPNASFDVVGFDSINGVKLRRLKESIRQELMERSLKKFRKEIGMDDGGTIKDIGPVLEKLVEEARARGYSENEIAAITYRNKSGDLDIPLMFSPGAEKFESVLMSLVKKVIDIKMPGKSYVQAASVGYVREQLKKESELTEDEKRGIVYVDSYDPSKPLRMMDIGEDGKVIPAQVLAPFNFFIEDENGNPIKARIENYFLPGTRTLDMSRIPKELLQLVGARIPNQGHNSMLAIEIVGFVPDNMGDLIIVASGITKQMGADFDVDKLYTYKRPYKHIPKEQDKTQLGADPDDWIALKYITEIKLKDAGEEADKDGRYDRTVFNKMLGTVVAELYPDGNVPKHVTKKATSTTPDRFVTDRTEAETKETDDQLKTQYFDIHWAVLTNKDMYTKVMQPLDKEDLADENELLRPTGKRFRNYYHTLTQISDFQSGKYAKQLVGMTSLSVTFNAVIQNKALRLTNMIFNGKGMEPSNYDITVHDDNGNPIVLEKLSGYGTSMYKNEIRTKADNFTTLQSAAVDNAKNRTLDNLNITPDTYNAAAAMVMLESKKGQAVNLTYATRMLTSNIIKKFSQLMSSTNDSLSEAQVTNLKEVVIARLKQDIIDSGTSSNLDEQVKAFILSPESMKKEMAQPTAAGQMAILNLFEILDKVGTRISQLQSLMNQDTKGAGQNLLTAYDKLNKQNTVLVNTADTGIGNERDLMIENEQATTFDLVNRLALDLVGKLLPYKVITEEIGRARISLAKIISAETLKPQLTVDTQKKLIKSVKSYVYSGIHTLWPDASGERLRLMYNINRESLAQRVAKAKSSWGVSNYFLQRLQTKIGITSIGPDFVDFNSAKSATYDDAMNVSAFMDLLNSDVQEVRILGEDLVRYAYLTGGNQDANSFITKIPISYLVATEFGKELQFAERNLLATVQSRKFITQYFQHNPDQAPSVDMRVFPTGAEKYEESFVLSELNNMGEPSNPQDKSLVTTDETGKRRYVNYISHRSKEDNKTVLYVRSTGYRYVRIDTLGNKHTDEYNGSLERGGMAKSVFQENRALSIALPSPSPANSLNNQVNSLAASMSNPDNKYEDMGLPPAGGDITVAHKMLQTVAKDKDAHLALRTIADVLVNTSEVDIANDNLSALFDAENAKFSIRAENTSEGLVGTYDSLRQQIILKPDRNKRSAMITLVHEFMHHRTSALIHMSGMSTHMARLAVTLNKEQKDLIEEVVSEFNTTHPEIKKLLTQLDHVRYQALIQLRNKIKAEKGEDAYQQMVLEVANNKALSDDHRIMYALSNLEEVVAHVFTDPIVARYLNSVQVKGNKSVLETIWGLLGKVLDALAASIGVQVNKGSALEEAATIALKLSTFKESQAVNISIQEAITENTSITVTTENEATEIANTLAGSYGKLTTIVPGPVSYRINVETAEPVVPEIQRVLDKLYNQQNEFRKMVSRIKTDTEEGKQLKQSIRSKINAIAEDIAEITRSGQLQDVIDTGKKQMQWATDIMNKPNPSVQEVMVAFNTLDIWGKILKTWYDGTDLVDLDAGKNEYSKELGDLVNHATVMKDTVWTAKAHNAFNEMALKNSITLNEADYDLNLKEMFTGTQMFLTLNRAENKLVATIATVIRDSAEKRDEEVTVTAKRIDALEMKMEKLVSKSGKEALYKEFMQENEDKTAWGFVQRYSSEWYSFIRGLDTKLYGHLERNKAEMDPVRRKELANKIFKKHWAELSANAAFVNSTLFFDANTGELLEGASVDEALEVLTKEVGTIEHAKELVAKGHKLYLQYLEDRQAAYEHIEEYVQLIAEDKAAIALSEKEMLLSAQEQFDLREQYEAVKLKELVEEEKKKWRSRESPNDFFKAKLTKEETEGFGSTNYVVMAPKFKQGSSFYDVKYSDIMSNPAKEEIFRELLEIRDDLIEGLPEEIGQKMGDNFLPNMSKEVVSTMMGKLGGLKPGAITGAVLKGMTMSKGEIDRINNVGTSIQLPQVDSVNIYKLTTKEQKEARRKQVEGWSTDIPRIMDLFSRVALHYKHMSRVLDAADLGETIVKDINSARVDGSRSGGALTKTVEAIEYYKQSMIFGRSKLAEAVSGNPIYSTDLKENKALAKEVDKLQTRREDLESKMVNDGLEDAEAGELANIEERLKEIADAGRYFVGSKMADKLISFNQLRALAFNPFAAVTNFSFGMISLFTHANGRIDYDYKAARGAFRTMTHATKKWFTFGQWEDAESQKILSLMQRGNIMNEAQNSVYGETNIQNRKQSALRKSISPLGWQHSGDYFNKGMLMIAMMKHKMVEVTEDGVTKKISLWDAHDDNGYWNSDKYGEVEAWYSDDIDKQTEWNRFKMKMKTVSTIVYGNQDTNAPLMARKWAIGRIIGQFRLSWFPEGIATRFQDERPDVALGRNVKGRYRTYADLGLVNTFHVLARQLLSSLPGVQMDAFAGVVYKGNSKVKRQNISELDKENMRKNLAGMAFTISILITMLSLKALTSPSEEEKKRRRKKGKSVVDGSTMRMINLLTRNYQDLTLYSSPSVVDAVLGNVAPSIAVINDGIALVNASVKLLGDDKKKYEKFRKKLYRFTPILSNINKFDYMSTKDVSDVSR